MKIVFFTFYYPPDLSAGSFRAIALAKALSSKMGSGDEIHVITTHPNRYASHRVDAEDLEVDGKITIHRIVVPDHQNGMLLQTLTFGFYAIESYRLCKDISPDFLIGTTGRLMTGVLTGITARRLSIRYFIDLRDIFSETISALFTRKNWILGLVTKYFFSFLDCRLLSNASGVNVVSEGFPDYFQNKGVDTSEWSFFPNGVDQEFVDFQPDRDCISTDIKIILYAGNIGSGQGLDTIVPSLAKQLEKRFRFVIVGDGGTSAQLMDSIQKERVNNVEMVLPVSRTELLDYYRKADILFLHLNNFLAFQRVLPSKIFEYAAIGKPIVAGLSGYSSKFIKEHLPYACVFESGDAEGAYKSILEASNITVPMRLVDQFIQNYSRESIMDKMAEHLLNVIKCKYQ